MGTEHAALRSAAAALGIEVPDLRRWPVRPQRSSAENHEFADKPFAQADHSIGGVASALGFKV